MYFFTDKCLSNNAYNVGIYVRLSREDENNNESASIANQKEYLTKYVTEQGWKLVDIYSDDGYTGTNFDRPDFVRLKKDIERKKINLVITKDLSRLGRDYIDTGYYLERYFPEKGVRYIALNDGIDTFDNSSNNDMSPFKSVMNDLYAKDISKKVRTTMNSKRKNGEFIGAFAPYGYLKSPEYKNKLIVDRQVALTIKKIFEMFINGFGYKHIAYTLNKENILCPSLYKSQNSNYINPKAKLKLWTQETIKNIITNPTYAGNITQNKYTKVSYKVKKLKAIHKDCWVTVNNTHEPIINLEAFNLAQQMAAIKANDNYSSVTPNIHLLSGLIFCQECGERMTFTKTQKGECYCICSKYKRFKLCSRHSYHENGLEKYIIEELKKQTKQAVNIAKLLKSLKSETEIIMKGNIDREKEAIEKRMSEIKRTIKILYEDKLKGIIIEPDFIDLSGDYNREREQLLLKLDKLKGRKLEVQQNQAEHEKLLKVVTNLVEFTSISKPVLVKLIERVELSANNTVTICYKFKKPAN